MDPKLIYWTCVWINMLMVVLSALAGVRRIRAGDVPGHRRRMHLSVGLVVLFLISYVFKLFFLGREHLEEWAPRFVHVLRFHEACVAIMCIAGGTALTLAWRQRFASIPLGSDLIPAHLRRMHRAAGRTAVIAASFGIFSAGYVLLGMWQRAV